MKSPLVSVVLTTYNRADLISETIESILSQTFRNFELIVVDDGSTDNTEEVVRSYNDERVHYIKTDNWGGPAKPRNIGIKKAKGEYIAFCDDDDLWLPNKLEVQLKHFDSDTIIGVGSPFVIIGDLTFYKRKRKSQCAILDFDKILFGNRCPLSSLIIKNFGFYFDESEEFKFVEDFDFLLSITLKTKKYIKILFTPLIYYRMHPRNEAAKSLDRTIRVLKVVDKYSDCIPGDKMKYIYRSHYYNFGWKALKLQSRYSTKYFIKSLKYCSLREKIGICFLIIISLIPSHVLRIILRNYYLVINT